MAKKKKQRVRTYQILNELYQYMLIVRIGGTREQAESWFYKKFEVEQVEGRDAKTFSLAAQGRTIMLENEKTHLIWFDAIPGMGLAAHEAVHSAYHVLSCAGLGALSRDTEEAYSYLVGWTVNAIYKKLDW